MLRRTGRVAVAAVAAGVGVARLHLFLEGAGLICSFRLACFVFGPWGPCETMDTWRGWLRIWQRWQVGRSFETRFQGQAVCIHDESASNGEDRVKSEVVLAQQAKNVHDYFLLNSDLCGPASERGWPGDD